MPSERPGVNPEFGEIVSEITRGLTTEQAAIRLDYALTGMTVSRMRNGKRVLEQTVRSFAAGFVDRIVELYGDEIRAMFGECDEDAAVDWLVVKAGFKLRGRRAAAMRIPGGTGELDYLPEEGVLSAKGYEGWQKLTPNDQRIVQEVMEAVIAQRLAKYGIGEG